MQDLRYLKNGWQQSSVHGREPVSGNRNRSGCLRDYYGATANGGASLIVSEISEKTGKETYILSLNVKYEQSYNEAAEQAMKKMFDENPYKKDMFYISKFDEMKNDSGFAGEYVCNRHCNLLLLLIVGMQNYINTMASSIQNRKLTFSIMESVGDVQKTNEKTPDSGKSLYASGSVFTLTVGTELPILFPVYEL